MAKQECEENIIMKVRVYSQWLEEVEVPVRTKQFTKAARLMGHADFASFAAGLEHFYQHPADPEDIAPHPQKSKSTSELIDRIVQVYKMR